MAKKPPVNRSAASVRRRRPSTKTVERLMAAPRTLDSLLVPSQTGAEPIDPATLLGQLTVQRKLNRSLDLQLTALLAKLAPYARGGSEAIAEKAATLIEAADAELESTADMAERGPDDLPVIEPQQEDWPAHSAAHNHENVAMRNLIARIMAFNALM